MPVVLGGIRNAPPSAVYIAADRNIALDVPHEDVRAGAHNDNAQSVFWSCVRVLLRCMQAGGCQSAFITRAQQLLQSGEIDKRYKRC